MGTAYQRKPVDRRSARFSPASGRPIAPTISRMSPPGIASGRTDASPVSRNRATSDRSSVVAAAALAVARMRAACAGASRMVSRTSVGSRESRVPVAAASVTIGRPAPRNTPSAVASRAAPGQRPAAVASSTPVHAGPVQRRTASASPAAMAAFRPGSPGAW